MTKRRTCAAGAAAGDRTIHVTAPTSAATSAAITADRQSSRARRRAARGRGRAGMPVGERVERKREIAGGLEPEVGRLLDAPLDDPSQRRGHGVGQLGRIRLEHRIDGGNPRITTERRRAGDHLVEDRAEGEDIGAVVDGLTANLLGRHVAQRAHGHTGLGQGRDRRCRPRVQRLGRRQLGDAEIQDLGPPVALQEQVLGLEIAVHDAAGVGGGQRLGDGDANLDGLARGEGSAAQTLAKGLPIEELRHDVRLAVGGPDVVDADDVGVRQLARGLGFDLEAAQTLRIGRQARRQRLDRHVAPEPGVARAVHLSHAAGAEEAEHFVGAEPGSGGNAHSAYSPPTGRVRSALRSRFDTITSPPVPAAAAFCGKPLTPAMLPKTTGVPNPGRGPANEGVSNALISSARTVSRVEPIGWVLCTAMSQFFRNGVRTRASECGASPKVNGGAALQASGLR